MKKKIVPEEVYKQISDKITATPPKKTSSAHEPMAQLQFVGTQAWPSETINRHR